MMAATWDFSHLFGEWGREINRLLPGTEFTGLLSSLNRSMMFFPARNSPCYYPQVNICEDAGNVHVRALAPGVDPKSLDIKIIDKQLIISGVKPAIAENNAHNTLHRSERSAGCFTRSFTLPDKVKEDKVKAEYQNGVLSLMLPKAKAVKPGHVKVKIKGA